MPHRFSLLLAGFASAVCAIALPSCAVAPAEVNRVGFAGEGPCPEDKQSLGAMLELSLTDPASKPAAHALAHFVENWKVQRGDTDGGEVAITAEDGTTRRYHVRFRGTHGAFPLTYFDSISPAIDYRVKKIEHHRRDGVGAPLVAVRENRHREPIEEYYPPEAITRPITAVIRPGRATNGVQQIDIDLLCPLAEDGMTTMDGVPQSLAADFTVPWAVLLSRAGDLSKSRFSDTLSGTPTRDPRLFLMEPYDPDKEPLIMIHGLFDSPLVWAKLSNELWTDEKIRNRYQIWHYLYNTSAPALYSGRILRTQLRKLRPMLDPTGSDPAMQRTTLLAHSMGGIVSRSLITRPGNTFWDAAFTRPFDSLSLEDSDRDSLKEAFFWEPETHVKRVIYIAVPHRGSHHADNFAGRLGRALVDPPNQFREFYDRISAANPGAFTPAYEALGSGNLDSVGALSPKKPSLAILAGLPNSHAVDEHSIIATRGKPGPLEETSDGVVEYWSSHIDRARSEKIVPYDHYAIDHEESVIEIVRILNLR